MAYNNENTFVLFLDEEKESDRHPDYTGTVELEDGKKLRLAAWKRLSQGGKKYLSGKVSEFQNQDAQSSNQDEAEF